jgi:hypothetical protein
MESMYAYLSTKKAAIRPDQIGSKGCGPTIIAKLQIVDRIY